MAWPFNLRVDPVSSRTTNQFSFGQSRSFWSTPVSPAATVVPHVVMSVAWLVTGRATAMANRTIEATGGPILRIVLISCPPPCELLRLVANGATPRAPKSSTDQSPCSGLPEGEWKALEDDSAHR